ncbi:hypothetical protein F5887DRAFT_1014436, partial [Amanita rubescens]
MPKELTASEQAMVAKASQDLHRYQKICIEHSAVFREDLEAFTRYQEYVAHPAAFAPHLCEPDRSIEDAENMLKKDCKTVLDHFQVVEAGPFSLPALDDKGGRTRKTHIFGMHSSQSGTRDPCVTIPSRFPASIDGEPAPLFDYPNTIPARTFKSEEVM